MKKKTMLHSVTALSCPCSSGTPYLQCCRPYHASAPAPTAEKLMRARYSAYALREDAYIIATWHPTTRPAIETPAVEEETTNWLGLEIRTHRENGDQATVEFVARYKQGGRAQRLHEVSRFVREAGWWWYLDGRFPKEQK